MPWHARSARLIVAGAIVLCPWPLSGQSPGSAPQAAPPAQNPDPPRQEPIAPQALQATQHPAVPRNLDDYWLVPSAKERAAGKDSPLGAAATAYVAGDYGLTLSALRRASAPGPLQQYALFYEGVANLRLSRGAEAQQAFDTVIALAPEGYLSVGAVLGKADANELIGNHRAAADLYERASTLKPLAPDDVLARLGRSALAARTMRRAANAFLRVYYEFPLTDAATGRWPRSCATLQDQIIHSSYKPDLGRAQILFGARRYADARSALPGLRSQVERRRSGAGRSPHRRVRLLPEALCRRARRAGAVSRSRLAAGRSALLLPERAARARRTTIEYVSLTRALVDDFPDSSWSEEALNNLGTHYIVTNEDELAAKTFKRDATRSSRPASARERAAWKYGWWAYKTGDYAETVRVFESAAASVPALGLPAVVPVLGGARARQAGRRAPRPSRACASSTPTTRTRITAGSRSEQLAPQPAALSTRDAVRRGRAGQLGRPQRPRPQPIRRRTRVIRLLLADRPVRRCAERAALRAAAPGAPRRASKRRWRGCTTRRASCAAPSR